MHMTLAKMAGRSFNEKFLGESSANTSKRILDLFVKRPQIESREIVQKAFPQLPLFLSDESSMEKCGCVLGIEGNSSTEIANCKIKLS